MCARNSTPVTGFPGTTGLPATTNLPATIALSSTTAHNPALRSYGPWAPGPGQDPDDNSRAQAGSRAMFEAAKRMAIAEVEEKRATSGQLDLPRTTSPDQQTWGGRGLNQASDVEAESLVSRGRRLVIPGSNCGRRLRS